MSEQQQPGSKMWSTRFRELLLVSVLTFCAHNLLHAQALPPQPFVASDRLQLFPITHPLKIAEPNDIPLHINDPNVKSIIVDWGIYLPGAKTAVSSQEARGPKYSLLHGPGGTSFIQFAPSVLGKLSLGIIVFFQDGGIARKNEDVETVLPSRPPEKFIIQQNHGNPWNTNRMYATVNRSTWLNTVAYYPGFDKPIQLPAANIVFHVLNDAGREPLQLDPTTGTIKPVNAGRALVQADFAGLTTFTCILVFPSAGGGSVDDCHDLLPQGKSFPSQPEFSPPKIRTRPSPSTNN
jgi:hypothetical protein